MTIQNYKVKGMSCHGCEHSVEMSVSKVPGVEAVLADAGKGSIEVSFSGDPAPEELIRQAVEKSGYRFVS